MDKPYITPISTPEDVEVGIEKRPAFHKPASTRDRKEKKSD